MEEVFLKNRNHLILNGFLIIGYIGALVLFVLRFIQLGEMSAEISKLSNIKKIVNISPENLILILSVLWTLISTFVKYGIAKLLTILCSESRPTKLVDVLIPKSIVIIFNIVMMAVFKVNSHNFFLYMALIGALLIFLMSYNRQRRGWNSFIFTLPFLIDAFVSLVKNL